MFAQGQSAAPRRLFALFPDWLPDPRRIARRNHSDGCGGRRWLRDRYPLQRSAGGWPGGSGREPQIALENGMTVRKCIEAVRELRSRGVNQPMLLMGYINPLLSYGIDNFVRDARAAGADGLIVPDLPPEEGLQVDQACAKAGLAHVYMIAPTSNAGRIELVGQRGDWFIYVVSFTGITGVRSDFQLI